MPEQKQFFGGLQTYTVFNRNLENDYGKMHSLQDFFLISYGVFDWLSLDLKGGAGDVRQRGDCGRWHGARPRRRGQVSEGLTAQ